MVSSIEDPIGPECNGFGLLALAITQWSSVALVEALAEKGAAMNKISTGQKSLYAYIFVDKVATKQRIPLIYSLIRHRCDPFRGEHNALAYALVYNRVDCGEVLLRNFPKLVHARTCGNKRPLEILIGSIGTVDTACWTRLLALQGSDMTYH